MTRLRRRTITWALSALVPVLVVAVLVTEPFVYVLGGDPVAYAEMTPRVIDVGPSDSHGDVRGLVTERVGGLITADLE